MVLGAYLNQVLESSQQPVRQDEYSPSVGKGPEAERSHTCAGSGSVSSAAAFHGISVHQNLVRSIPPPQPSLSAALPPPPLLLPTPIASLTWRAAPANRYSPSGPCQTLLTSGHLPSPAPPGWIIVPALPGEDSLPAGVLISDTLPWRVGLRPAFPESPCV